MIRTRSALVIVVAAALLSMLSAIASAAEPHKAAVTNIRRAFHNGEHNAFTDLVRFKDRLYLTFRSCPDGHMVHPSASIIVLSSVDGTKWEQVNRFHVPKRDTRDPHFLVFKDKLFVYTGTWFSGDGPLARDQYDLNLHLGYAVRSDDGTKWSEPTLLEGTFGHYIWRAATFGDKAYLCGRRKTNFEPGPKGEGKDVESVMLESDDGLIWRKRGLFQETQGDETAFFFEADGSVRGIGRRTGNAQYLRAVPPYTEWERREMERPIGGPLIIRWGENVLVGGRKTTKPEGPRTFLAWLVDGKLHDFAELPSAGDNSYPGFVELSPTRGLVSWYSSHEKDEAGKPITAIYLADLSLHP